MVCQCIAGRGTSNGSIRFSYPSSGPLSLQRSVTRSGDPFRRRFARNSVLPGNRVPSSWTGQVLRGGSTVPFVMGPKILLRVRVLSSNANQPILGRRRQCIELVDQPHADTLFARMFLVLISTKGRRERGWCWLWIWTFNARDERRIRYREFSVFAETFKFLMYCLISNIVA